MNSTKIIRRWQGETKLGEPLQYTATLYAVPPGRAMLRVSRVSAEALDYAAKTKSCALAVSLDAQSCEYYMHELARPKLAENFLVLIDLLCENLKLPARTARGKFKGPEHELIGEFA